MSGTFKTTLQSYLISRTHQAFGQSPWSYCLLLNATQVFVQQSSKLKTIKIYQSLKMDCKIMRNLNLLRNARPIKPHKSFVHIIKHPETLDPFSNLDKLQQCCWQHFWFMFKLSSTCLHYHFGRMYNVIQQHSELLNTHKSL